MGPIVILWAQCGQDWVLPEKPRQRRRPVGLGEWSVRFTKRRDFPAEGGVGKTASLAYLRGIRPRLAANQFIRSVVDRFRQV